MKHQHLFVYGSLAKGRKNAHVLENIGGFWSPASIYGRLIADGWGSDLGYPGLVLDENAALVDGFVFSSPDLQSHWEKLDSFEGEEYNRVLAEVLLSNNKPLDAFVYVLNR